MANNIISNLVSQFQYFATPYKFQVVFNPPPALSGTYGLQLQYFVRSVTIPEISNEVMVKYMFGEKIPIPGRTEFGELAMKIAVDSKFNVLNYFENWYLLVTNNWSQYLFGNNNDISSGTIILKQYDQSNMESGQITFYGAFPVSIGDLVYDYESNDDLLSLDLKFQYQMMV